MPRVQVLGDATVRRFGSRDVDSWLLPRERAAVADWEARGEQVSRNISIISTYLQYLQCCEQFHVMRDGPFHHTTVLAGLWGGDNYANFSRAREVRARLLGAEVNQWKFYDQKILKTRVWPIVRWALQSRCQINFATVCTVFEEGPY